MLLKLLIATPRSLIWPDPHFDFEKQTDWETKYLWQASETGAILFWLAKQIELSPIDEATGFNRIYSQTTRFELGEWKTRTQLDKNIKMVVGIEKGFADGDYVRQRFQQDCPHIPVTDSLEETCQIAVELVSG